jgi:cadmium resistance protein CadD (predicted permease)
MIRLLTGIVITFAVTNIDDIFLLTLFFARRVPTRRIVAGQYVGFFFIILVSCVGAFLALAIPTRWIHLLGLLPLALGIKELLQLRNATGSTEPPATTRTALSIALITLSNGADNIGVYVPFLRFNSRHIWLIVAIYGLFVGVWCLLGRVLGRHPVVVRLLDRAGHRLVPFLFIGLGIYILAA